MNSTVEKLTSNKIKLRLEVDADRFEAAVQAAYLKNRGKISVQGFRRGKAPRKLIEIQYGEKVFHEDAIDILFPEIYGAAIDEHKLEPVDRPELAEIRDEKGEPLVLELEVSVKPDVALGKYLGVEAEKHTTEVSEDDVKAEIERMRQRAATNVDVTDRPAKLDDTVTIDYAGTVDGVAFEGGTAEDHRLTLGSGSFIPGFEDQLVGAEAGSELDVNVTFPEDYHASELAGKPAVFHVKVKSIQERDVPELDDEFAKDVSECDTLEQLTDKTRADLKKRADERDENAFESAVIEACVEGATIDVPEAMVRERIDERLRETSMRFAYQGMRMEDFYRYTGQTEEQLREAMKDDAERDVRTRLVIEAIMKAENVEATPEEVDAEIESYVSATNGNLDEFKKTLGDNDRDYFAQTAKTKKTINLVKAAAVAPAKADADAE